MIEAAVEADRERKTYTGFSKKQKRCVLAAADYLASARSMRLLFSAIARSTTPATKVEVESVVPLLR